MLATLLRKLGSRFTVHSHARTLNTDTQVHTHIHTVDARAHPSFRPVQPRGGRTTLPATSDEGWWVLSLSFFFLPFPSSPPPLSSAGSNVASSTSLFREPRDGNAGVDS